LEIKVAWLVKVVDELKEEKAVRNCVPLFDADRETVMEFLTKFNEAVTSYKILHDKLIQSIKTMVWRSKHNQPLKQNSQESEVSPTRRRCEQSNETMTHLFKDCPHPEGLAARSRALQQLFEEAQVDARTWEEIVTRKADPAETN
jgi:hypothetical protein